MFNSKSRECDTVYKKSNSVTFIFLLLLFSVLAVTLFVDNVTEDNSCDNRDAKGTRIIYCPENGGQPYKLSEIKEEMIDNGGPRG